MLSFDSVSQVGKNNLVLAVSTALLLGSWMMLSSIRRRMMLAALLGLLGCLISTRLLSPCYSNCTSSSARCNLLMESFSCHHVSQPNV